MLFKAVVGEIEKYNCLNDVDESNLKILSAENLKDAAKKIVDVVK